MTAIVDVTTTLGDFAIELYGKHAPHTCHNFTELVRKHYYDGCPVHRIAPGFVIQTGDPTGTGRGGDTHDGKPLPDEFSPDLHHTGAGIIAMANTGAPNSARSSFYITLAPSPTLDGKHTIFGRVCRGMGVVEKLSRVPTGADERPTVPIQILRARVAGEE